MYYFQINLNIANFLCSQYLLVHVCCLKIHCLGKLPHIFVNIFLWFLILTEFVVLQNWNVNVLLIILHSLYQILLPGIILYPVSLFVSLFSCKIKKKKIRLWDIVLRIKEVFFCLFNKRNINHNIPFYIELETHKNSKFGKRCLAGKAWDAHLIPSSN